MKLESLLKTPDAVRQAKEAQKGWHWALEILVFVLLFVVCTFGEILIILPFELVLFMGNQRYLSALESDDMEYLMEVTSEIITGDVAVLLSLFATSVMLVLVLLFCKLIQKRKMSSLGFIRQSCIKEYLKGILFGFLLFSAAVFICILTGSLELSYTPGRFAVSSFLLFLMGYMIQGMAEEVLCRGYFMVSLGRRYPMVAAVVLNATAFAALHLLNPGIAPLAIINLILFGIFASVCFIYTENLWLIGALHSVWNLLQGNVYGIKVSGMENTCSIFSSEMTKGREIFHGGDFGLEGGLAVTIVLMAGIVVLLVLINKKKDTAAEEGI